MRFDQQDKVNVWDIKYYYDGRRNNDITDVEKLSTLYHFISKNRENQRGKFEKLYPLFELYQIFHQNGKILMIPTNYWSEEGLKWRKSWDLWTKIDKGRQIFPCGLPQDKYLPKDIASSFKWNWKLIFKEMKKALRLEFPQDTRNMNLDDIRVAHKNATTYLLFYLLSLPSTASKTLVFLAVTSGTNLLFVVAVLAAKATLGPNLVLVPLPQL